MRWNIDLRYAIPAVISLIFVVLPSEDNDPWIQLDNFGIASHGYPIFVGEIENKRKKEKRKKKRKKKREK
jgi:hypothetical protein